MVAFHGCLLAGLVPVALEVPITKRVRKLDPFYFRELKMYLVFFQDAGIQQLGFLLGSCMVKVALTSESCLKGLPKSPNGDVIDFKGKLWIFC